MATTTSNLALTKPASGESYNLDVINQNTQKIDDFAGKVNTNLSKLNTAAAYANNQNLNNYTTTGSYHVGTDTSSSPTGAVIYGILVVYSAHDTIVQVFIQTGNDVFTRVKASASSSWSSWKAICKSDSGTISTGINYKKYGNVVTIFINNVSVSTSGGWSALATLPSGCGSPSSVHVKSIDGTDLRVSGNSLDYRGSASTIYGTITYVI